MKKIIRKLWFVLIVSVIVVIAGTMATIYKLEKQVKTDTNKYLTSILESTHQGIISWAKKHTNRTEALAKEILPLTEELLKISGDQNEIVNSPALNKIRDKLKLLCSDGDYMDFFLIGPENINLASLHDANIGELNLLAGQEKAFKKMWSGETALSMPILMDKPLPDKNANAQKSGATMFAGTPVKDKSGKIIALFALQIDYSADLAEILERGLLGNSGETYCVNETGLFLSNSRYTDLLRETGLIQPGENIILNLRVTDPGVNLLKGEKRKVSTEPLPLTVMGQSLTKGQTGSDMDGYRDYRGVPVVGAWKWDDLYDFGIVTEIDTEEVYARIYIMQSAMTIFTVAIISLLLGLAALFYRGRKQLSASEKRFRSLYENSVMGIYRTTPNGKIVLANPALVKMLGFDSFEELAKRNLEKTGFADPTQRETFKKILTKNGFVNNFESEWQQKNGKMVLVSETATVIKDEAGNIIYYDGTVHDISERRQAEHKYKHILDTAIDGFWVTDMTGRLLEVNNAYCKMSGYTRDELLQMSIPDLEAVEHPEDTKKHIETVMTRGRDRFITKHRQKNGTIIDVEISAQYLTSEENPVFVAFVQDVTEHIKAKQVLEASENLLKRSQNISHVGSWELDAAGKNLVWSDETYLIFGMLPQECPVTQEMFFEMVHSDDRDAVGEAFFKSIEDKQDAFEIEHRVIRKHSGEIRSVLERCEHVRDASGNIVYSIGMVQDITESKRAEQALRDSETMLNRAQSVAQMGSWRLDVLQNVLEWSHETYHIFGVPDGVTLTYESFLSYIHPDDRDDVDATWNAALKGAPYNIEHRIIVNGDIKWVSEKAELEIDHNGTFLRGIGTVQDITEKKLAEEKIKASLAEKEVLLKEIHHRVKNNLQIVGSLIYLQSLQIEDQEITGMLNVSLNRIKAMSLAHEYLYQSEDLKKINLEEYLRGLISVLKESYLEKNDKISIELYIKENVEFEKAIYCGLIINELVSNALKYAFKGLQNGKVAIRFEKQNNEYMLSVSDNGSGIPNMDKALKGKSLGLKIVETLAQQLNGSINYKANGGTKAEIKFPV